MKKEIKFGNSQSVCPPPTDRKPQTSAKKVSPPTRPILKSRENFGRNYCKKQLKIRKEFGKDLTCNLKLIEVHDLGLVCTTNSKKSMKMSQGKLLRSHENENEERDKSLKNSWKMPYENRKEKENPDQKRKCLMNSLERLEKVKNEEKPSRENNLKFGNLHDTKLLSLKFVDVNFDRRNHEDIVRNLTGSTRTIDDRKRELFGNSGSHQKTEDEFGIQEGGLQGKIIGKKKVSCDRPAATQLGVSPRSHRIGKLDNKKRNYETKIGNFRKIFEGASHPGETTKVRVNISKINPLAIQDQLTHSGCTGNILVNGSTIGQAKEKLPDRTNQESDDRKGYRIRTDNNSQHLTQSH